ncbi:hypothetical protein [Rhodopseudomonas palustris]|uniref:Uncharacterized protein n=1 Tax=Rhodopseudomonas palustris (strain BisB18) TaxID=316056 RepID=Q217Y4_RHOPB
MAVVNDNEPHSAKKSAIQSALTYVTGATAAAGAVCGTAWYLLSPRVDKYIDDHLSEKMKVTPPLGQTAGPGGALQAGELQVAELQRKIETLSTSVAALSSRLGQAEELQRQLESLGKIVSEIKTRANFNATYGYSFRFKGAEILAQQRPPSRLYFYATRDDEVKVSVYLATQKFPITMKVDGIAVRPKVRDSRDSIRVTDQLVHTSLEEVIAVKEGAGNKEGAPPTTEDPRPQNVHYIEFLPGDVNYQFGKNDDYDVSGIVLVARKNI